MAEHAEAKEGCGFDPQGEGAEGNWTQAGGAELGVFVRGEIAFGTDPDGGVGGAGGGMAAFDQCLGDGDGVGLKGGNERPVEFPGGDGGEGFREREWRVELWQPILAALFAGFDGDALPFGEAIGAFGGVKADDGPLGEQRNDLGGTEFDGFFDDPLEGGAFWDGDGDGDPGVWWGDRVHGAEEQAHLLFPDLGDPGRGDATGSVEHFHQIAGADTQHRGGVPGLGGIEDGVFRVRGPSGWWEKESHGTA